MKTVYELYLNWVEYGEPSGGVNIDYNDKYGSDLKGRFERMENAEAEMKRLQCESPLEKFEIKVVEEP